MAQCRQEQIEARLDFRRHTFRQRKHRQRALNSLVELCMRQPNAAAAAD
jgi:hypothetical protein